MLSTHSQLEFRNSHPHPNSPRFLEFACLFVLPRKCIPCGGAVRADAASTKQVQRGMAGGYAGHNEGGHIWGNNTKKWKGKDYTGPTSTCKAVRIRSVYGEEIAGGFTGLMESADTASAGNLSLLWGLVKVDNILGALSVVYPTE